MHAWTGAVVALALLAAGAAAAGRRGSRCCGATPPPALPPCAPSCAGGGGRWPWAPCTPSSGARCSRPSSTARSWRRPRAGSRPASTTTWATCRSTSRSSNGFVRGQNFPPEHPELAGVRLTYPFGVDLAAAPAVAAGAIAARGLPRAEPGARARLRVPAVALRAARDRRRPRGAADAAARAALRRARMVLVPPRRPRATGQSRRPADAPAARLHDDGRRGHPLGQRAHDAARAAARVPAGAAPLPGRGDAVVGRAARAGRAGRAPPDDRRRRRGRPAAARARARVRRARERRRRSWRSSSGAGACGPASRWPRVRSRCRRSRGWRTAARPRERASWAGTSGGTMAPRTPCVAWTRGAGVFLLLWMLALVGSPEARDPRRRRALPGAVRALVRGAERPAAVALDLGQREVPVLLVRRVGAARGGGARLGLAPRAGWGCRPRPSSCSASVAAGGLDVWRYASRSRLHVLFDRDAVAIADRHRADDAAARAGAALPDLQLARAAVGPAVAARVSGPHLVAGPRRLGSSRARAGGVRGHRAPRVPAPSRARTTCSTVRRSASSR